MTIGLALRCQFLRSVNWVLKLLLEEVGGVACAVSVKKIGFVAENFSSPADTEEKLLIASDSLPECHRRKHLPAYSTKPALPW